MKRIHVTGCPRSGTTLMTQLMRIGFRFSGFCEHEMSIFEKPEGAPDLFLSKQPSDIKRIGPLLKVDPNLFCIYMVRDPRSVITSVHRRFPDKFFCNFQVWNECDQAARTLINHPRFLRIRYEDLVKDPHTVQIQIQKKFPFLFKLNPFDNYHSIATPSEDAKAALGGIRKISTEKISTWKNFLPRVKYEAGLNPEMFDILISHGYEANNKWASVLESVNAQRGDCRYPDKKNTFKGYESKIRNWIKTRRYIANVQNKLIAVNS